MGLVGNNKELELGARQLWQNLRQVQQTEERNMILWRRKKLGGIQKSIWEIKSSG